MYTYARGDGLNDPSSNGEYWLLQHALSTATTHGVLLDVGANKGNWAAKALDVSSALLVPNIHAFEPSEETRLMLAARFASNSEVMVEPYAVSNSIGEATFYSHEVGGGTNSLSHVSGLKTETVKLTTIDHFLQERGIAAVQILKIDTEGFDLLALRGAEISLKSGMIEVVQFEYNWRWLLNNACLRDVFELMAGKPYCFGKLIGETIEFYDEWHFELDRFFENNYVLIRTDSKLCALGSKYHFNAANVRVPLEYSRAPTQ